MQTTTYTSPAIAEFDMAGVDRVCRRWGVRKLSLFGSLLHGDARPDSDVDLLYEMEPGGGFTFISLATFQDALQIALGGRVPDLCSPKYLHEFIRDRVIAEARVIYERS